MRSIAGTSVFNPVAHIEQDNTLICNPDEIGLKFRGSPLRGILFTTPINGIFDSVETSVFVH